MVEGRARGEGGTKGTARWPPASTTVERKRGVDGRRAGGGGKAGGWVGLEVESERVVALPLRRRRRRIMAVTAAAAAATGEGGRSRDPTASSSSSRTCWERDAITLSPLPPDHVEDDHNDDEGEESRGEVADRRR